MPFVSKAGMEAHILKIHKVPPKQVVTKLFPPPSDQPTCRICFHEVERGLSLADHCKLLHNLEVSTDRAFAATSLIQIEPPSPAPPTSRFVKTSSKIQDPNLQVSLRPSKIPCSQDSLQSRTFINSKFKSRNRSFIPNSSNSSSRLPLRMNASSNKELLSEDSSSSPPHLPVASTIKIQAEIHQEDNKPRPLVPSKCSLCNYSTKINGLLKLHYQTKHKPPPSTGVCHEALDYTSITPVVPPKASHPSKSKKVSFQSRPKAPELPSPTIAQAPPQPVPTPARSSQEDFASRPASRALPSASSSNSSSRPCQVSFINKTLQYSFPLCARLDCPVKGCSASFGTKHWYHTNASIKKHLTVFHQCKPSAVKYWCSICSSTIIKHPANHPCLSGNLVINSSAIDDSLRNCSLCNFTANNNIAKRNHLAAHKRNSFKLNASSLQIPIHTRFSKAKRHKRITELSEGMPGDTPLAPPLISNPEDSTENSLAPEIPKLDLQRPKIIDSFFDPLKAILEIDDLEEASNIFQNLMVNLTSVMQEFFHLSPRPTENSNKKPTSKPFDPNNAQRIQRLYRWNRRRCIKNLTSPDSSRCPVSRDNITDHFKKCWSAPTQSFAMTNSDPPDLPPVLDVLTPEFVASCLQGCENSAPDPDLLTYKHWREADPRGSILSTIFNICLKLKDIPADWKSSNCILLPKKGDLKAIENWRPISLSNTVYKLFSKCLTRRLQDWCEMHNILSKCQKGFTPYDGVVEHNFIIGQHLENARRSHTNAFLVWLDISNAFGSIPHEVLFVSLKNAGVDSDFIHLINNIYNHSSTRIITEEGLSEPVPLRCGVKQGCPLSGPLFNLAINHILVSMQDSAEKHS
ncbi:transposon TX1 uncharacterized 149 kDa protein, partial [Nephila pilipes]